MPFHSRRSGRTLRLLVWLVFALGVVVQPVMAAAGELHELAHDPSGSHTHAPHGVIADPVAAPEGASGPRENPSLHLLLDLAHCCGGAVAVLPMLKGVVMAPAEAQDLALGTAAMLLTTRLSSPFKPPIVG
ncbi:hypothetical protein INQ41_11415 [Lysobacter ciconiae]|uniref:Uncharacterized protein n=1 Tax=Novilysobacter ciconiae TaxID=2781022 RepID=A0A7S6UFA6_9GAMM|nr:hypothetical protein [Lysobacter ciconiae]QOW19226.1 hypothetical protein INQ41_11415 [Lysobacter ciconiae]